MKNILLNRDTDDAFYSLKKAIIDISRLHRLGEGNLVEVALPNFSKFEYIKIVFNHEHKLGEILFFANDFGNLTKLNPIFVDGCYKIPTLDLKNTNIVIKNNIDVWLAWKGYSYKIIGIYQNSDEDILFESFEAYECIRKLIGSLNTVGFDDLRMEYLYDLVDCAEFKSDWKRLEGKSIELFNDSSEAIFPYVMSAHGVSLPISSQGEDLIIENIPKIIYLMNRMSQKWFCTSGTLLGLVRDGKFIPYDDDLDFVVFLGNLDRDVNFNEVVDNFYEKNKDILDKGMNNLHYRLKNFMASIDVFLSWQTDGGPMNIYPWCYGRVSESDVFPVKKLSISQYEISAPANPEKILSVNYGDAWMIPDPLWRFNWDESNLEFEKELIWNI